MKNFVIYFVFLNVYMVVAQEITTPREIALETSIERAGDYMQFAPAAASVVAILANGDGEGFWQFAQSMGANLTATWILKYAINKPRPEGRLDGHAFPSGHTSMAFQGAAFMQRRYGWAYGIPAYAVAGFVAYSRLEGINDRHDGWDVIGGIVVGICSSYLLTTPYRKEHFELTFEHGNGDYLLGVNYKF
jgi:membrane-associated phospholipid phosphatase